MAETSWRGRAGWAIIAVDVLAIALFIYLIPVLRRPVDILSMLMIALGVATAALAGRDWVKNLSLVAVALGVSLFVLDLSPKIVDVEKLLDSGANEYIIGGGDYDWGLRKPHEYVARVEQAEASIKEEMEAPPLQVLAEGEIPASDIFKGIDKSKIRTRVTHPTGRTLTFNSLKPYYIECLPLGYEMTPDNLIHEYTVEDTTRTVLYNTSVTVNGSGLRETRGNPDSDEIYVFMGCSVTFGAGLNDDETSPYFFSRATGFDKNVMNLGVNGYGHHQCLRDLEVNHSFGKAGIDASRIKAVVLQYFDEHNLRAANPVRQLAPRYAMENGRAVYQGAFNDSGRLFLLLERSRLYPILRERLFSRMNSRFQNENKEVGFGIVAEMHRLCRERYGIPLTVVYWMDEPDTIAALQKIGVNLILVSDILGKDWRKWAVKFQQFDTHPNAYCTRLVGEGIHARLLGGEKN